MFKFEKLVVWQKSLDFADQTYSVTRMSATEERFGLTNQIRRVANSVLSNIAEGSAYIDADFARFVGYASDSLYDGVTQSFIARRQKFLSEESFARIYTYVDEISRMLSGLRSSLGS
jgi:four helix bundle protein